MYSLYEIAALVNAEPPSVKIYLLLIENAVNKAIIQHERIAHDKLSLKNIKKPELRMKRFMTTLFSDIHHYLICWAEVSKLYDKLRKIQPIFKLPTIYVKELKEHRTYRNHLEHIDDRVEKGVSDLGNLAEDKFSFNGKYIDVSDDDLEKLKTIYEELIHSASKNFPQPFRLDFVRFDIESNRSRKDIMDHLKKFKGQE